MTLLLDVFAARTPAPGTGPSFLIILGLLAVAFGLLVVMLFRPFVAAWRQYRSTTRAR